MMSRRTITGTGLGALAFGIGSLLGPLPAARDARAVPPQGAGKAHVPLEGKRPHPRPPPRGATLPPPDEEPPDPDFDLKQYTFTTDQAIQLFEARVKRDPRDAAGFKNLGEFY